MALSGSADTSTLGTDMAYFANGTEGMVFDEECTQCIFGDKPCPIYYVQSTYNYDACNIPVARKILADLVSENTAPDGGRCQMLRTFWSELHADKADGEQQSMELV